jgi:integrase
VRRIGGAKGTYFTRDELQLLLLTAKIQSERDWLMILVTLNHGLRASETINLTAGDIRDGHLWVSRLKGSQRTCQPLLDDEREALIRWASNKVPSERLFPISRMQFWRIMRKHCHLSGLSPIAAHPHSLKHSMCRAVLDETGNLQVVKQYAGHSSITSTLEYTRPTDAEASKAAARGLQWFQPDPDEVTR